MKMNYFSFGQGAKTMAILPGISLKPVCLDPSAVIGAYQQFQEDFTVYLFDVREDLEAEPSIASMADDVYQKLLELGLKDLYVYGVSMGGMIAQQLALDHPELIKKLAMCSSCDRSDPKIIQTWLDLCDPEHLEQLIEVFCRMVYSEGFCDQYLDMVKNAYLDTSPEQLEHFRRCACAVSRFDLSEAGSSGIKTLIIGSKEDRIMAYEEMKRWADHIAAESYFFAKGPHAIYDEQPKVKKLLLAFFRK